MDNSDSKLQGEDVVEIKSVLEIAKTEYLYDENIVKTAERLGDHTLGTESQHHTQIIDTDDECQLVSEEEHNIKPSSEDAETNHKCEYCEMSFSSNYQLKIHIKMHTLERPYACAMCEKSYMLEAQLICHQKAAHKTMTNKFVCETCNESFTYAGQLKVHLKLLHSGDTAYKCEFCSQPFAYKADLLRHVSSHTEERPFSCSTCGKTFKLRRYFRVHQKIHMKNTTESKKTKNVCERSSGPVAELGSYQMEANQTIEKILKRFACEICNKSYNYASELKVHLKLHSGDTAFKCEFCSKPFGYKAELTRHLRAHTGERPFTCSVCGNKYKHKRDFHSHQKTHMENMPEAQKANKLPSIYLKNDEEYTMEDSCSTQDAAGNTDQITGNYLVNDNEYTMKNEPNFEIPAKSDQITYIISDVLESGSKSFTDGQSDSGQKIKQDVDNIEKEGSYFDGVNHFIDSEHKNLLEISKTEYTMPDENILNSETKGDNQSSLANELPNRHICEYCSVSFSAASILTEHLKIHTDERPLAVPQKLPNSNDGEKIKTSKSKETIHKCGICSKRCISGTELKRHSQVHTGERPFVCVYCDQTYKHEDHLKYHQKVHQNEIKRLKLMKN